MKYSNTIVNVSVLDDSRCLEKNYKPTPEKNYNSQDKLCVTPMYKGKFNENTADIMKNSISYSRIIKPGGQVKFEITNPNIICDYRITIPNNNYLQVKVEKSHKISKNKKAEITQIKYSDIYSGNGPISISYLLDKDALYYPTNNVYTVIITNTSKTETVTPEIRIEQDNYVYAPYGVYMECYDDYANGFQWREYTYTYYSDRILQTLCDAIYKIEGDGHNYQNLRIAKETRTSAEYNIIAGEVASKIGRHLYKRKGTSDTLNKINNGVSHAATVGGVVFMCLNVASFGNACTVIGLGTLVVGLLNGSPSDDMEGIEEALKEGEFNVSCLAEGGYVTDDGWQVATDKYFISKYPKAKAIRWHDIYVLNKPKFYIHDTGKLVDSMN